MHHDWLVENDVTMTECGNISYKAGDIIKGFCFLPEDYQEYVLVASAASDKKEAELLIKCLETSNRKRRITKEMENYE